MQALADVIETDMAFERVKAERDKLLEIKMLAQAVVESERNERVEFEFYAPIEVCKAIEALKAAVVADD
jgi:hypothetical protein